MQGWNSPYNRPPKHKMNTVKTLEDEILELEDDPNKYNQNNINRIK